MLSENLDGISFDKEGHMRRHPFGSSYEAFIYPILLVLVMWVVFWADHLFAADFYKFGVRPKNLEALKGILFMPLLHSKVDWAHIVNNSFPTLILLGALIFYYRSIALRVFALSWLFTGVGLWLFATDTNSYHIGISGVIYALAGFLFTSGVLRKYLPLQGISLFVAFLYGSMIWGIFPMETHVSWEGHLSGLLTGVVLAVIYRKKGPQRPKFQYEIEKEMGIEPPDLEGQYNEMLRQQEERKKMLEEQLKEQKEQVKIVYHYKESKNPSEPDGNDASARQDP